MEAQIQRRKHAVLIVEDDEDLLKVVGDALNRAGLEVIVALSPEDALNILETRAVSAILLDWTFTKVRNEGSSRIIEPNVTGEPVLLKAKELDPFLPVVVMSGFTSMNLVSHVLSLGAASFLLKVDFTPQALSTHIWAGIHRWEATKHPLSVKTVNDILPLQEATRQYALSAVEKCDNNVSKAAEYLGVHRHTISSMIRAEEGGEANHSKKQPKNAKKSKVNHTS